MDGEFTHYRELDFSEKLLFEEAFGKLDGVKYTAFAVSTQVVSKAINYKFLCSKLLIVENPPEPVIVILPYTKTFGEAGDGVAAEGEIVLK